MALTKITANIIEDGAITASAITNTSITADKLHTTLDLTGKAVTVATATAGDNDTTVASTAFVSTAIANLADSAPATLDTLNELAAALGDDANFSTTVTNSIALKAPLASPTFTGTLTASGLAYPTSDGTNGQVLTTDGSGTLSFSTVSVTGTTINNNADNRIITGSGTANTLEGESGLTYNGSTLAVTGTLNIDSNGGVDNYYLRFKESGADRFTMYENSNNVYLNGGPGNTIFRPRQNGGTGNFAVTGSNVGIGTTSPATKLNVSDSSGTAYKALTVQSSNVNSDVGISLIGGGGSDFRLQQPYNSAGLFFYDVTNNAERMRIDSSGNVGIGTTSPNAKLEVTGSSDGNLTSAIFANTVQGGTNDTVAVELQLAGTSGQVAASTLRAGKGEDWTSGTSRSGFLAIEAVLDGTNRQMAYFGSDGDGSSKVSFSTNNSERMRIDASGNVGIGTTSPNQDGFSAASRVLTVKAPSSGGTGALELIGLANSSGDLMSAINFMSYAVGNPAARITALRHTADDEASIAFDTSGAERMRITQAGNVGIGTTSPSTELHVYSADQNALTVQTNTGINQIGILNSTNSPTYIAAASYVLQLKADDNGWGGTASAIQFNVKGTERFKIAHDGETTITGTKMNVISSAEAVMGAQATGNSYWRVVADNSPNTYFQAGTGQSSSQVKMYFTGMYGSNNTMTVDTPNSRVGIGTTSPGKKLDVRGTIRATAVQNDISLSDELPGYGANSYGNLKASTNNIYLAIGNSYIGYINSSAQLNASDARLKENVATLTGALDKVNQLRGVSFNWIDSARGEGTHIGFIAQELEAVYPELVGDGGLPDDDDGQSAIKSVDYGHMVPVLVEAIKELKAENDALRARLDAGGL